MPIRLILADLDGTLLDSMPFWKSLPYGTLKEDGIPVPEDLPQLIRSMPMWRIAGVFAQRFEPFRDEKALYASWMETMRENYAQRVSLKPGALAFLETMKRAGIPVCLLTATARDLLQTPVERFGLQPYLTDIVTEADTGSTKSTPVPYEYCMQRFAAKPEKTLLLEDSFPNLRAAAALGMPLAGVYDETMAAHWPDICALTELTVLEEADWSALAEKLQKI